MGYAYSRTNPFCNRGGCNLSRDRGRCGRGCGGRGAAHAVDNADVIFAFGDFKFGYAAFAHKINERL